VSFQEPIRIAVVGHTNAGKTSLLRTLTRRVNFGEVSRQPGTTRHVEAIELQVDGRTAVRFLDTPGLEDAVALRVHIDALDERGDLTPPERIRRFLAGPEAHGVFVLEA
jgi:small GTP-binding protein